MSKPIITLLLAMICASTSMMHAVTYTKNIVFKTNPNGTKESYVLNQASDINNQAFLTVYKGSSNVEPKVTYDSDGWYLAVKANHTLKIHIKQSLNLTITSINFEFQTIDGTTYSFGNPKVSIGHYDEATHKWTGACREVSFTIDPNFNTSIAIMKIAVVLENNVLSQPAFSPPGGSYDQAIGVTMSADEGATIYYTTDDSQPTTGSTQYTNPINVSTTTKIKAIAQKDGVTSITTEATYEIIRRPNTPVITLPETTSDYHISPATVTIAADEGATIYYTTDGSDPRTNGKQYSDPIILNSTTTIKAAARFGNGPWSETAEATCNIIKTPASPTLSASKTPTDAGYYIAPITVSIISNESDVTCMYYLDSDGETEKTIDPDQWKGYDSPVEINTTSRLYAKAMRSGIGSTPVSVRYVIRHTPKSPVIDLPQSETDYYADEATVTITADEGATIYYTTDLSEPTETSEIYNGPFILQSTTTIKAIAVVDGLISPITTSPEIVIKKRPSAPTFSPAGSQIQAGTSVELACNTANAMIYYTCDNSDPREKGILYTSPIAINATTTIRAAAKADNGPWSEIAEATYTTYNLPKQPIISLPDTETGYYVDEATVTITADERATIYYTTDLSEPTETSTKYDIPFKLTSTATIKAIAVIDGIKSPVMTSPEIVIKKRPAAPTFNPAEGAFNSSMDVTIACETPDVTIYYTIDGSDPHENGTKYATPIKIDATTTVKAVAKTNDGPWSELSQAVYTLLTPHSPPLIEPRSGTYNDIVKVTLTAPEGARIRYSIDSEDIPATEHVSPHTFTLDRSATVRAVSVSDGNPQSQITTATYTIVKAPQPPVITLPANEIGYYVDETTVTITADEGTSIYYTVDESDPTIESTLYNKPFKLKETSTIKAIAVSSDNVVSQIATIRVTIKHRAATPTFNPTPGLIERGQKVEIKCVTHGAEIHVTTDGTDPTQSGSIYNTPLTIDATTTIKAAARTTDGLWSEISEATYTVLTPNSPPLIEPAGGTYADSIEVIITATEGAKIRYTLDEGEFSETEHTSPHKFILKRSATVKAVSVSDGNLQSQETTVNYVIVNTPQPPIIKLPTSETGYYVDSVIVELSTATKDAVIHYTTDGTEPTIASTVYDRPFKLTSTATINAIAAINGVTSKIMSKKVTIKHKAGKLTFTPPAGTYTEAQTVKIVCDTRDATIYYTIDGSEPSPQSAIYQQGGTIPVTTTTTIKAVAVNDDIPGDIESAKYVINLPKLTEPIVQPPPGIYGKPQKVIFYSDQMAKVYWSLDSVRWTEGSFVDNMGAGANTTLWLFAAKGNQRSDTIKVTYRVVEPPKPPKFGYLPGSYAEPIMLALIAQDDAPIYFTTDGSEPDTTKYEYYTPLRVDSTLNIRAAAIKNGVSSQTIQGQFNIKPGPEPPKFDPQGGEYNKKISVTLTAQPNADIYFTTDGSDPINDGRLYYSPIEVGESMTIKAVAVLRNVIGKIVEQHYVIKEVPKPPKFSVETGTYYDAQTVKITSEEGCTVRYTTDGSNPTLTSTIYTSPIVIKTSVTLKAISIKKNVTSTVSEAAYTIATKESATSIASFIKLCADNTKKVTRMESALIVTAAIGNDVYVTDGTNHIRLSAEGLGSMQYSVGNIIEPGWEGTYELSGHTPTIVPVVKSMPRVSRSGNVSHKTVMPEDVTLYMINQVVDVDELRFDSPTPAYSEGGIPMMFYGFGEKATLLLRTRFAIPAMQPGTYRVTALVGSLDGLPIIYPMNFGLATAIDDVGLTPIEVTTVDGGIVVAGLTGVVTVYDITGRIMATREADGQPMHIELPRGAAIVKAGATVTKVLIK